MQFISCQITTKCDDLIHTPQSPHFVVNQYFFVVISVLFDVRASKRAHTFFGYILYYSTDELQAQDLKYICQIRDNDLIDIITDCLELHKSVALLC